MRDRFINKNQAGYIAPPADEWEVPVSRVALNDELGTGQYGKVFKAVVTGGLRDLGNRVVAAVKQSHSELVVDDIRAFFAESNVMKQFSAPHHPNVCAADTCLCIEFDVDVGTCR
jgi:hypothetical protein